MGPMRRLLRGDTLHVRSALAMHRLGFGALVSRQQARRRWAAAEALEHSPKQPWNRPVS